MGSKVCPLIYLWRLLSDLICSSDIVDQSVCGMTVCKMHNVDVLFYPPRHTSVCYPRDNWCKGEFMHLR